MRGQSGMTLLELLVALMVLAMTGLLLSQGLSFGNRIWNRAGVTAETEMARFDAAKTLRRLIEQAEPGTETESTLAFSGDASTLSLQSFEAARLAGGRGRQIDLHEADGADAVMLTITDPEGVAKREDLVLFDHASGLALRYFGRDQTGTTDNAWTDHWTAAGELPLLVQVRLDFTDGTAPMILSAAPRKRYGVECMIYGRRACPEVRR